MELWQIIWNNPDHPINYMNIDQIEFRNGAIDPTKCIGEAWNTIGPNYWFLFGVSIVAMLLAFVSGLIPLVSIILGPLITGPLFAGVYWVYLAHADGEKKEFGAIFDGFKKFGPNAIVGFILAIPGILMQIYQLTTTIAQLAVIFGGGSLEELSRQPTFTPILIGLYIFMIVFGLTVGLLLFFSYLLIMDFDLGAVDAMKLSSRAALGNFGGLFVLIILEGLLMFAGALACFVGIFFMMPVIILATVYAYRSVFPREDSVARDMNPPSPDQYQFGGAP